MPSSRRKAIAAITGGAALLPVLGQVAPQPTKAALSKGEFALLSELTERIIPKTDTPGAIDAGVPRIIEASLTTNAVRRKRWKTALGWFSKVGKTPAARLQVLERVSREEGTPGAAHFGWLKSETIDIYYSTMDGLKTELGWNANTFLSEFKGCTHPEHKA